MRIHLKIEEKNSAPKKIISKPFLKKSLYKLIVNSNNIKDMKLNIDNFEKDLLIETIEYRLENDEDFFIAESLKEDLQELLRKIEDEYL